MEAIGGALITAVAAVVCQILINRRNRAEDETKRAVKDKEIEDRLEQIEGKLDIHNGYAEKLGSIAISLAEIRKDIEYLRGKA